jgi:hypothetical protein
LEALAAADPALHDRFTGDPTFRSDGRLAAVSRRAPSNVEALVEALGAAGLVFVDAERRAIDVAVVGQNRGPTTAYDWLECYQHDDGYAVACLPGDDPTHFAAYAGWSPGTRPDLEYVPMDDLGARLRFLRREDGRDVFLDTESGTEVAIARPPADEDDDGPD